MASTATTPPALSPDGGWTVSKDFRHGAGPWLNYKVGTAVRATSRFNNAQIDHVKWLVTRNTVSISLSEDYPYTSTPTRPAVDWANLPGVLDRLLQMLIRPEDGRDTITLNSNELVLVLNSHGAWPKFDLRHAVDETVRQLHARWNYWPVRVYGGYDIQSSAGHKGLTLTLLNVVNTDLGGPSMVQLLDEPVTDPAWNRVMVRKVYRDRHFVSDYAHPDLMDWVPQERGYSPGFVSEPPKAAEKQAVQHKHVPEPDFPAPASPATKADIDDDEGEEAELFETAAETQHLLPDRPPIQHPTWPHSTGGEPLVDYVGRHAKRFATPDSGIGEDEGGGGDAAARHDSVTPAASPTDAKRARLSELSAAHDDDSDEMDEDFEMV